MESHESLMAVEGGAMTSYVFRAERSGARGAEKKKREGRKKRRKHSGAELGNRQSRKSAEKRGRLLLAREASGGKNHLGKRQN